jgi:hypothetical protein
MQIGSILFVAAALIAIATPALAQPPSVPALLRAGYELKAVNNGVLFLQKGDDLFACVYNTSLRPTEAVAANIRNAFCQRVSG